jgi:hypothetical protein
VLIGGQAINFWATYYQERDPQLLAGAPYTSKDVDFCGSHAAVTECALRLGGKAKLATLDDMNTPNTGVVMFVDDDGWPRRIDFLSAPAGVDLTDLVEQSVEATVASDDGMDVTFRVMHPLHCLRSRAYNVAFLEGYGTEHAKRQLRAAIVCARQYVLGLIAGGDLVRARDANEEIFDIAYWHTGRKVYAQHGINIFSAVEPHPSLDPRFLSERFPRMRSNVDRMYARTVALMERRRTR